MLQGFGKLVVFVVVPAEIIVERTQPASCEVVSGSGRDFDASGGPGAFPVEGFLGNGDHVGGIDSKEKQVTSLG